MSIIDNLEAMLKRGRDSALLRYGLGGEYLKSTRPSRHSRTSPRPSSWTRTIRPPGSSTAKHSRRAGAMPDAVVAFDRGIEVAQAKGDAQAAKEMQVFRKRALSALGNGTA
jgi:hypothetical protein